MISMASLSPNAPHVVRYVTYFGGQWRKEHPHLKPYAVLTTPKFAWKSKMDTNGFRIKIRVTMKPPA